LLEVLVWICSVGVLGDVIALLGWLVWKVDLVSPGCLLFPGFGVGEEMSFSCFIL